MVVAYKQHESTASQSKGLHHCHYKSTNTSYSRVISYWRVALYRKSSKRVEAKITLGVVRPDHSIYEETSIWAPLLMQLGRNFLTQSDWVNAISHSHEKVEDSNGKLIAG
jgi:hypothetical protein